MVAAYRPRRVRSRHVATSLIVLGGGYPVVIICVRVADRLRGRSRASGFKNGIRVTATLTFDTQGGGIDQITRRRGNGGEWNIPLG